MFCKFEINKLLSAFLLKVSNGFFCCQESRQSNARQAYLCSIHILQLGVLWRYSKLLFAPIEIQGSILQKSTLAENFLYTFSSVKFGQISTQEQHILNYIIGTGTVTFDLKVFLMYIKS
jgi:hypothetical protein